MKGTAKDRGMEVNTEVDERYNLEISTQKACEYLQEAYDKFGSWTMAAASYNVGMNGITRRSKEQNSDNYYDLLLPTETSRYVFRIIARYRRSNIRSWLSATKSNPTIGTYVEVFDWTFFQENLIA